MLCMTMCFCMHNLMSPSVYKHCIMLKYIFEASSAVFQVQHAIAKFKVSVCILLALKIIELIP